MKRTKHIVLSLSLLLCFALPVHGYTQTPTETTQSITIPMQQWQSLKSELTVLNSELVQCKSDLTRLKKPSAELLSQLEKAEKTLLQLQTELAEQKNDLNLLSKEAEESKTLLTKLKEQIDKERRTHKRQIWQNRIWCIIGGVAIGFAIGK